MWSPDIRLAVPTNSAVMSVFRFHVIVLSAVMPAQPKGISAMDAIDERTDEFLPRSSILHPWPSVRFTVRHLR
jgi:RNA-directed DNA polymerase